MQRDDQEFTTYVGERRPRLYRTAYLLCGDPHQAEDIVQTALAKAYVAWRRMRDVTEVDAYVRTIVVNAFRDDVRRAWRRHERSGLDGFDRSHDAGIAVEEADALWTALRALPTGQRKVVVLRHYWGLSVEETAADLGISPGTVKSQTSEAIGRLRAVLAPATGEGNA